MTNENMSYLYDWMLAIVAVLYTSRLVYVRFKRESIMKANKPGTARYNAYRKLSSAPIFAIATVATTLILLNLALDTARLARARVALDFLVAAPIVLSGCAAVIFYIIFASLKKK